MHLVVGGGRESRCMCVRGEGEGGRLASEVLPVVPLEAAFRLTQVGVARQKPRDGEGLHPRSCEWGTYKETSRGAALPRRGRGWVVYDTEWDIHIHDRRTDSVKELTGHAARATPDRPAHPPTHTHTRRHAFPHGGLHAKGGARQRSAYRSSRPR